MLGRLLLTLLLPLVVFGIAVTAAVRSRAEDARNARHIVQEVDDLALLIELRAAVFTERTVAGLVLPSVRPPESLLAETAVGARYLGDPTTFARATDDALAALAPDHRPLGSEELVSVRAISERTDATAELLDAGWRALDAEIGELVAAHLRMVRHAAISLGDLDLIEMGATMDRSTAVPAGAGEVVSLLAQLWSAQPAERRSIQAELIRQLGSLEEQVGRVERSLTELAEPSFDERWRRVIDPPESLSAVLEAIPTDTLADVDRPPGEPVAVGLALLDGVDWLSELSALPPVTVELTSERAALAEVDAEKTLRRTTVLSALAAAAVIATALLFGRSIVRPVGRLTDRAQKVGAGRLDLDPLPVDGPPEVAGAAQAFNDMVDNLALLERKAQALADHDFEHPSLKESLPGQIGASLERSVEALQASVVERDQLQQQVQHEASHDALTGLPNRRAVHALLESLSELSTPTTARAAVVFLAIDDFKRTNDRYGHTAGDSLLRVVAARLRATAPPEAVVARIGGDEFGVVLAGVKSVDEVMRTAGSLLETVREPAEVSGQRLVVRATAGVAVGGWGRSAGGSEPLELLRRSDLAVHEAKALRRGGVLLYDDELHRRLADLSDMERALAAALEPGSDELRLVFQPIVDARRGHLRGMEVLLRWDRDGRPIPPDVFIPVAERSLLIRRVDRWVLQSALAQVARWKGDEVLGQLPVSVNISGRTLIDGTVLEELPDMLHRAGVPPSQLVLEVTETALISDLLLVGDKLRDQQARGVRIAIDDFGTGYTSVAQVHALPADEMKIDSSFVQGLPDRNSEGLIAMIVQLAHHLGVPTVAEGVETAEQRAHLVRLGCDLVQGYLISRPLPADELSAWARAATGDRFSADPLPPGPGGG